VNIGDKVRLVDGVMPWVAQRDGWEVIGLSAWGVRIALLDPTVKATFEFTLPNGAVTA
jgi:hypothetical protein